MDAKILQRRELARDRDTGTAEFQGAQYDVPGFSFLWVEMSPGEGPRLHQHPYQEVFIILEGRATYTVGTATLLAEARQIVIAPANTPHKFVNSGDGPLRQIDIHASDHFVTEWLED